MYYDDHNPPHFHAVYGSHEAQISIATLEVLEGGLPSRATQIVKEWAGLHQVELRENWQRALDHVQLEKIDPLE
jgi:hypothetical protein